MAVVAGGRKISAASARAHTRKSQNTASTFQLPSGLSPPFLAALTTTIIHSFIFIFFLFHHLCKFVISLYMSLITDDDDDDSIIPLVCQMELLK